jgi:hypothetical protein
MRGEDGIGRARRSARAVANQYALYYFRGVRGATRPATADNLNLT